MSSMAWRWVVARSKQKGKSGRAVARRTGRFGRLGVEPLEQRILLATDYWTNALGGSWSDPTNWSTGSVPGATDSAVINLSGQVAVHLSAGTTTINSLQVNNSLVIDGGSLTVTQGIQVSGALSLESGNLSALGGLAVTGGTLNFDGASFSGAVDLLNSGLNLGASGTGAATFVMEGSNTLSGNISAGQTVQIQGDSTGGTGALSVAGSLTNSGTIDLTSSGGGYSSQLTVGGALVNSATGSLIASYGSGGARNATASSYSNSGTMSVDAATELDLNTPGGATPSMVQAGGDLAGTGALLFIGGSFTYTGGSIDGSFYTRNTTIDVQSTVSNVGTIRAEGASTLVENAAPSVTVWAFGSPAVGTAVLTTSAGAVNDGTILLQSVGGGYNCELVIGGSTLVNAATGTIAVNNGNGGQRTISGDLVNGGLVTVDPATSLTITGLYDMTGGQVIGPGYILNSQVEETVAPAVATSLFVAGSTTLTTDNLAGVTLLVQGNNVGGNATLTTPGGLNNYGTIDLTSANGGYNAQMTVGGNLTNAAVGMFTASQGAGGSRNVTALSYSNFGTFSVDAATELDLNTPGGATPSMVQAGGDLAGTGALLFIGGNFTYTSGAIDGSFYTRNTTIDVRSTVSNVGTIRAEGASTLVENAAPDVTVWAFGSPAVGSAVITTSSGAVNDGTILLQSVGGGYNSELVIGGSTLVNSAIGIIAVNNGNGGQRTISGDLVNAGSVTVDSATSLTITGVYVLAGGQMTGPAYILNAQVTETVAPAAATSLLVAGNSTLTTDNLVGVTLFVQGNSLGGNATLTTPGSLNNYGTINLTSANSGYNAQLTVGGTLTNAATGVLEADPGSGGHRLMDGNLTNYGTVTIGSGLTFDEYGVGGNTLPALQQAGGTLAGAGIFELDGGQFDYTGGTVTATFWGLNIATETAASVTATSTIQMFGHNSVLMDNAAPGVTIRIEGDGWYDPNGVLTVLPGATNAGTIDLEAFNQSGGNTSLVIDGSLTNDSTGTIAINVGGGGYRSITGDLDNQGLVDIEDAVSWTGEVNNDGTFLINAPTTITGDMNTDGVLTVQANTSLTGSLGNNGSFTVAAGSVLDITGSNASTDVPVPLGLSQGSGLTSVAGQLVLNQGLLAYEGGSLATSGLFQVTNALMTFGPSLSGTATVQVVGIGDTLLDNSATGLTIWVAGGAAGSNQAVLNLGSGAINAGTIDLQSPGGWGSYLSAADAIANTSTGVIDAGSGAASITGNLLNEGTITVASGVSLQLDGNTSAGPVLTQAGGTIEANGQLTLADGSFNFDGGTLSGTFYGQNSQIYVSSAVTSAAVVRAIGTNCTLVTNNSPDVTIWVDGGVANQAQLTALPGAENAGVILLESSLGWGSYLSTPNTLINDATGLIDVEAGADALDRQITGNLINEGILYVAADTQLAINSTNGTGPTLIQDGGVIDAAGPITLSAGLLDFQGGAIGGQFYANSDEISVAPSVTTPSLINVVGGAGVLLDNYAPQVTLWIQGNSNFNQGTLTAAPNAVNMGTILLSSVSQWWSSSLAAPNTLVNGTTGSIKVFQGLAANNITGTILNEGYMSFNGMATMEVDTVINEGIIAVDATGLALASSGQPEAAAAPVAGQATDVSDLAGNSGATDTPDGVSSGTSDLLVTQLDVRHLANYGIIGVDAGTELQLDGADPGGLASPGADLAGVTLQQIAGTIRIEGRLIVDVGGSFLLSGGEIDGDFIVRNGRIEVDSASVPTTVRVLGTNNTLLDNNSTVVTLRVQGCALGGGDAVLTTYNAATNIGKIVLESLDGTSQARLVITGKFTNEPGGVIQVSLPDGTTTNNIIQVVALGPVGDIEDDSGLPELPQYQEDPSSPMASIAGVDDGVIGATLVGGSGDGTVSLLSNFGDVLVLSAGAPINAGISLLSDAFGSVFGPSGVGDFVGGISSAFNSIGSAIVQEANTSLSIYSYVSSQIGFGSITPIFNTNSYLSPSSLFTTFAATLGEIAAAGAAAAYFAKAICADAFQGAAGLISGFAGAVNTAVTTGNTGPLANFAGQAAVYASLVAPVALGVAQSADAAAVSAELSATLPEEVGVAEGTGAALEEAAAAEAAGNAVEMTELDQSLTAAADSAAQARLDGATADEAAGLSAASESVSEAVASSVTGCFVAGTPLLAPDGPRPVEEFVAGDKVVSRSEHNPEGPLEVKQVEEVVVRLGAILELRVGGRLIETTGEHPFWVEGKGWRAAKDLAAGDRLRCREGRAVIVETTEVTDRIVTVYNFRVADFHTYFVGDLDWGFAVWSHNDSCFSTNVQGQILGALWADGVALNDAEEFLYAAETFAPTANNQVLQLSLDGTISDLLQGGVHPVDIVDILNRSGVVGVQAIDSVLGWKNPVTNAAYDAAQAVQIVRLAGELDQTTQIIGGSVRSLNTLMGAVDENGVPLLQNAVYGNGGMETYLQQAIVQATQGNESFAAVLRDAAKYVAEGDQVAIERSLNADGTVAGEADLINITREQAMEYKVLSTANPLTVAERVEEGAEQLAGETQHIPPEGYDTILRIELQNTVNPLYDASISQFVALIRTEVGQDTIDFLVNNVTTVNFYNNAGLVFSVPGTVFGVPVP